MPTEIFPILDLPYDPTIAKAAAALAAGQLVVLPTETIYGTFALLTHPAALTRLRALRTSNDDKPLTPHLASREQALQFIAPPSDLAQRMMQKLWPGPVGLTFDVPADRRAQAAASLKLKESDLYSPDGTITLRCPDHPIATDVLTQVGTPAVAISAGTDPKELSGKVDLILDVGPARYPKPSTLIKITGDTYAITREGLYDQRMIEKLLRTTLLFICSGNTCRSPMSEAIARHLIAQHLNISDDALDAKGISVLSAGAMAAAGSRATPAGVSALRDLGIDLTKHRSRPLTVDLIHQADHIFTMGRAHKGAVLSLVPSAADKTSTLDPAGDIDDPFGSDESLYRQLATTLQSLITTRLKERALL